MVLVHGLFVSWQLFLPVVERLQEHYHIVVPMLSGHLWDNGVAEPSVFHTIDEEAQGICDHLLATGTPRIACLYGISLGGGIAARVAEQGRIAIDHLVIDAGPIVGYSKWFTWLCAYYQAANCWCTYHCRAFYRRLFPSHYFQTAIEEVAKTFPSGGVQTPVNVYKSLYAYRLAHLPEGTAVQFWYGSKEAWLFRRCERHIKTLRCDAHVMVFPKMQHAQLIIDRPEVVAQQIASLLAR